MALENTTIRLDERALQRLDQLVLREQNRLARLRVEAKTTRSSVVRRLIEDAPLEPSGPMPPLSVEDPVPGPRPVAPLRSGPTEPATPPDELDELREQLTAALALHISIGELARRSGVHRTRIREFLNGMRLRPEHLDPLRELGADLIKEKT